LLRAAASGASIVETGVTGHAESVKITYDPSQVSYEKLLEVFFSVAHDPTEFESPGSGYGDAIPLGHLLRMERNPNNPYIVYNDLPKLARLKERFPELVKHR
jgi:peptide-methionine (S)-S-oxide reductase